MSFATRIVQWFSGSPANPSEPAPAPREPASVPEEPAAPEKDPVNMQRLDEVTAGDRSIESEFIGLFLESASRHVTSIDEALTAADWDKLHMAVHALKGSSGTMGADELHTLLVNLERQSEPQAIAASVAQVRDEVQRVRDFFQHRLQAA